jgi:Wiskott-Aldrich syndrome protein
MIGILQKVDQGSISSSGSGGDERSELMSEIRKGVTLRQTSTREPGSNRSSGTGTDALAEALRKALAARDKVIHSSDEDSDNTTTDNDGEWDD